VAVVQHVLYFCLLRLHGTHQLPLPPFSSHATLLPFRSTCQSCVIQIHMSVLYHSDPHVTPVPFRSTCHSCAIQIHVSVLYHSDPRVTPVPFRSTCHSCAIQFTSVLKCSIIATFTCSMKHQVFLPQFTSHLTLVQCRSYVAP
jgi:hypothetical protein